MADHPDHSKTEGASVAPPAFEIDNEDREALGISAEVLGVLIRLFDREAEADLISGLKSGRIGMMFAELLPAGEGHESGLALQAALDALPEPCDSATLDNLAADYADTFLTHGYRLSPNGSVWMTEERLERQEPMFAVREWYSHYGLNVPDWRVRADDHLVHELQFVQHLLQEATPVSVLDAARFLDRHVLPWVPEYGRQMAVRCQTPFLAASGAVLADYLPQLRQMLEAITGEPIRIAPLPSDKKNPKAPDQTLYIPGAAPSW